MSTSVVVTRVEELPRELWYGRSGPLDRLGLERTIKKMQALGLEPSWSSGEEVRARLREVAGVLGSCGEMATLLGVSRNVLRDIFRGRRLPGVRRLLTWAELLQAHSPDFSDLRLRLYCGSSEQPPAAGVARFMDDVRGARVRESSCIGDEAETAAQATATGAPARTLGVNAACQGVATVETQLSMGAFCGADAVTVTGHCAEDAQPGSQGSADTRCVGGHVVAGAHAGSEGGGHVVAGAHEGGGHVVAGAHEGGGHIVAGAHEGGGHIVAGAHAGSEGGGRIVAGAHASSEGGGRIVEAAPVGIASGGHIVDSEPAGGGHSDQSEHIGGGRIVESTPDQGAASALNKIQKIPLTRPRAIVQPYTNMVVVEFRQDDRVTRAGYFDTEEQAKRAIDSLIEGGSYEGEPMIDGRPYTREKSVDERVREAVKRELTDLGIDPRAAGAGPQRGPFSEFFETFTWNVVHEVIRHGTASNK